eukprot:gene1669-1767_t
MVSKLPFFVLFPVIASLRAKEGNVFNAHRSCYAGEQNYGSLCSVSSEPSSMIPLAPNIYGQVKGQFHLNLTFFNMSTFDEERFCYVSEANKKSTSLLAPTLRFNPGDEALLYLHNCFPGRTDSVIGNFTFPVDEAICGARSITPASTNIHFHGFIVPATCNSDLIVTSIVNFEEVYQIRFTIPLTQPPGLYWYHPHLHGNADDMVEGGGSGAMIIEGIDKIHPIIKGLTERILVIREVSAEKRSSGANFYKNLSINYALVNMNPQISKNESLNQAPILQVFVEKKEFWRLVNSASTTVLEIQIIFDGAVQNLTLIALDGVSLPPTNSRITQSVILGPANRVEFIVTTPSHDVRDAKMITKAIDFIETRPLMKIRVVQPQQSAIEKQTPSTALVFYDPIKEINTLRNITPDRVRRFYFSQIVSADNRSFSFFITGSDDVPQSFNDYMKATITVYQNTTEDWIIQNRAVGTYHVFHIHQGHYLLLEKNQKTLPPEEQVMMDVTAIEGWNGKINTIDPNKNQYPSIRIRLNFTSFQVGKFVFHCHKLSHEDLGMMRVIEVLPPFKYPSYHPSSFSDPSLTLLNDNRTLAVYHQSTYACWTSTNCWTGWKIFLAILIAFLVVIGTIVIIGCCCCCWERRPVAVATPQSTYPATPSAPYFNSFDV